MKSVTKESRGSHQSVEIAFYSVLNTVWTAKKEYVLSAKWAGGFRFSSAFRNVSRNVVTEFMLRA